MDDEQRIKDEKARQEHEQTERAEAVATRSWGYTVLVWAGASAAVTLTIAIIILTFCAVRYGVPAVRAWGESNKSTAEQLPAMIRDVDATITKAGTNLDTLGTTGAAQLEKAGQVMDAVRTETVPLVNKNLATSNGLQGALTVAIQNTSSSVNDKMVPQIVAAVGATKTLMDKYGLTADEASSAIKLASEKTGKSLDELNKQIADPRWGQAADNLVATSAGTAKLTQTVNDTVDDAHRDLHATMEQWPHITSQIDKTATNISKFSKAAIIAGIISNLANGFLPGLLH